MARGCKHPASYRDRNVFFRIAHDENLGRVVRLVQWPSYFDPVLERYRRDPRLLDILAPLIGADLKQIINQLHWKPPGAATSEFGYHQDIGFRRPRSAYREPARSYIQTVIAVDPHRADNGGITVYPGSHALGELSFPERGRIMNAALSDRDLADLGLDPSRIVALELDPGDLALWGLYTIHGSGPNVFDHRQADLRQRLCRGGQLRPRRMGLPRWRALSPGEPTLVHYEDLYSNPGPLYVEEG